MVFGTNKERGNAGLSMAIAYFGANGYVVSIPLNDTQDYDLVVEKDRKLYKVQVKATGHKGQNGSYVLGLRTCGGREAVVWKTVRDTDIDLLFALDADKNVYLIPKDVINNNCNSITLGKKYAKYLVTI